MYAPRVMKPKPVQKPLRPSEFVVGKIYRVVKPKRHDRLSDIRVLDESGDDYLYPRGWFVPVELPLRAKKALVAIH